MKSVLSLSKKKLATLGVLGVSTFYFGHQLANSKTESLSAKGDSQPKENISDSYTIELNFSLFPKKKSRGLNADLDYLGDYVVSDSSYEKPQNEQILLNNHANSNHVAETQQLYQMVPVKPYNNVATPPVVILPEDKEHIMKYGYPSTAGIRFFEGFVAAFDNRTRNACWSCQRISSRTDRSNATASRQNSEFKEDHEVPELFRSKLSDYRGSGYDRGHLVPAADLNFHSQKAMNDTFYLTNVSPQVAEFNRQYWARLEHFARKLTKQYHEVYICTGPLYMPAKGADGKWQVSYQTIGNPPVVAVPTHFYKVILAERNVINNGNQEKEYSMGAFILPNAAIPEETPVNQFAVPVEAVELFSGLQFFSAVPRRMATSLCSKTECTLPPPHFWEKKGGKGANNNNNNNNQKALPPPATKQRPALYDPLKMQVDAFAASAAREVNFPSSLSNQEKRNLQQYAQDKNLDYIVQTGTSGDPVVTLKKK